MSKANIFSALGLAQPATAAGSSDAPETHAPAPGLRLPGPVPAMGSRRKRVWELEPGAHCPLIGVCLTMRDLRRLAARHWPDEVFDSDYGLHGAVVSGSRSRNPIAEAVQKELEARFGPAVRQASSARDAAMLAAWWRGQAEGTGLAGALWATLTHPRCDAALAQQVIGEVHMLQHQVGTLARVDARRLEEALGENAALAEELAQAQVRIQRISTQAATRIQGLEGELLQSRAALIGRDTLLVHRDEQLRAMQAGACAPQEQELLRGECERLTRRVEELAGELAQLRAQRQRQRERAVAAPESLSTPLNPPSPEADHSRSRQLADRAVLCVGGRTASVPLYRVAVQRAGARFLHHDGDDGDKTARLEETLRAADLVICQTGCISHGAYWRVKDHCKRTGTPCVFVETPSRSALERALGEAARRLAVEASGANA